MKRVLLTLITLTLMATGLIAENGSDMELPNFLQGLGVAAGHYSGVGMSYKFIYKGKYSAQITGGYYADEYEYRWAMPGIALRYHLSRHKNTSFFISTGLSWEYIRDQYYYWYECGDEDYCYGDSIRTTEIWTTGAGFGMEAIFFDRISVTVETILYYRDNERASIMVQGGLHYYFNMNGGRDIKSETPE